MIRKLLSNQRFILYSSIVGFAIIGGLIGYLIPLDNHEKSFETLQAERYAKRIETRSEIARRNSEELKKMN